MMREMVTCLSEHAVRISETTCSSSANQTCISNGQNLASSVQNAVICQYKITLSNQKQLLVTLTWCRNHMGQGLNVGFGDDLSTTSLNLNNTISRLFRKKKKGSKSFEYDGFKITVFCDLSMATYGSGPEPIDGFCLILMVGSDIGLVLGDLAKEMVAKKIKNGAATQMAKFSLVSRREHYSGTGLYSTKAQFCDTGVIHEIMIRCVEGNEGMEVQPVLSVSIDKRTVTKVKRLEWNFRGNQTILVDGLLVDLLWDVHDWFFNPVSGSAVFMFRTRSGIDNRLWVDEKKIIAAAHQENKEHETVEFSLLIYASKNQVNSAYYPVSKAALI